MPIVRIFVNLKPSILDPEGQTIEGSLKTLGYKEVKSVRVGKVFEVEMEDVDDIDSKIKEFSEKLLVNPIIEEYSYVIVDE